MTGLCVAIDKRLSEATHLCNKRRSGPTLMQIRKRCEDSAQAETKRAFGGRRSVALMESADVPSFKVTSQRRSNRKGTRTTKRSQADAVCSLCLGVVRFPGVRVTALLLGRLMGPMIGENSLRKVTGFCLKTQPCVLGRMPRDSTYLKVGYRDQKYLISKIDPRLCLYPSLRATLPSL